MDTLHCNSCDKQVEIHTEKKANNLCAYCKSCGVFIKNIPTDKPRLYVGKYKGKAIDEIDDVGYLQWAVGALSLNVRQKQAITDRIIYLTPLMS